LGKLLGKLIFKGFLVKKTSKFGETRQIFGGNGKPPVGGGGDNFMYDSGSFVALGFHFLETTKTFPKY